MGAGRQERVERCGMARSVLCPFQLQIEDTSTGGRLRLSLSHSPLALALALSRAHTYASCAGVEVPARGINQTGFPRARHHVSLSLMTSMSTLGSTPGAAALIIGAARISKDSTAIHSS